MYLREMGLSKYEAQAYAGLLRQGTSTAKGIASDTEVPQSRVYDVLDSLESKGFVNVQPGRPKKFGPVSPETAVDQYTEFKRREQMDALKTVRDIGDEFIETVDSGQQNEQSQERDIGWSYPNRFQILDRLESFAEDTGREMLLLTTPKSFERIMNHHGTLLERKQSAGVTIRALVDDKREITEAVRVRARELMDLRRVEDIHGRLYLYDGADVLLAYHAPNDDGYVGISTSSGHLHRTLSHLFEVLWADATPLSKA